MNKRDASHENEGAIPNGDLPQFFSPALTLVCVLVCLLGFGVILRSTSLSEKPILNVSSSRDLERLASRILAFEAQVQRLSSFEQVMYALGAPEQKTQDDLLLWYKELLAENPHILNRVYLGLLLGEFREPSALEAFLEEFPENTALSRMFREMLAVAYLGGISTMPYHEMQARLAEEIPGHWFYYQLSQRLAERAGDGTLQASLAEQLDRQGVSVLWHWRVGLGMKFVLLAFGGIGLALYLRTPFVSRRPVYGFWTFGQGVAVLSRGGAMTVLVIGCLVLLPTGPSLLREYGAILLYLPIVIVSYVLLFRSRPYVLSQVFGWSPFLPRLRASLPVALMVVGVGLLGDWGMMIVGDSLGYTVHWTEWFVPDLVWGSWGQVLKTLTEFVIVAPFFEEIIFRGLLFPTLHAKVGGHLAIMGSALFFALAHGYGFVAFLAVLWSGLLWGWAYARTGSLLPGMIAHAINNGLVGYSLLAFFR